MKETEGFIFKEAPDFYKMNSRGEITNGSESGNNGGERSMEDIDEESKKQSEKEDKRGKNKAPSVKEIREYKRKLIKIHAKDLELNFPSAYPVLGLKDDENEDTPSSSSSTHNSGGGGGNAGGNNQGDKTTKKRKRSNTPSANVTNPRGRRSKR